MGFSRERVSASDPTDLIRMVDETLRQLDDLRGNPRFMLLGTTNTAGMIDDALIDRADLVVQFEPPDYRASLAILQRAADRARGLGIDLDQRELAKAAKALTDNGHKPSGRLLSKLPFLGFVEGGSRHPTASTLIEVARKKMAEECPWL
jgi:SpoVK/Ycf46/Vps4 family AAA+-type ATPase